MFEDEILLAQGCNLNKPSSQRDDHNYKAWNAKLKDAINQTTVEDRGLRMRTTVSIWLTADQKKEFKERHDSYRRECERMGKELDFLIAHYRIVGHLSNVTEASEKLKKDVLDTSSLLSLEKAMSASTGIWTREALQRVREYLTTVSASVAKFRLSLDSQKHTSRLRHVKKWEEFHGVNCEGQNKLNGFLEDGDLGACLKYLHSELFKNLEKVMRDVFEELSALERNSVNTWLKSKKTDELEQWYKKYINHVTSSQDPPTTNSNTWTAPEMTLLKERCERHKRACEKIDDQLRRLIGHYEHIFGPDNEVIQASQFLKDRLFDPMETIEWYLSRNLSPRELLDRESLKDSVNRFGWLHFAAYGFQHSLYHQKHAFYFHSVEQWVARLWNGWRKMIRSIQDEKSVECLKYMQDELFPALEDAIKGIEDELEKFREKSLPSFLADEKDRDTTQYANITTIATFFSSVTATALQISYSMTPGSNLVAVINLFWFVSLVFSVSSGVSSLLGLMWRKSSIYHTSTPPKPIRLWLEKAPMVLLIIAALVFIVGLNLLAFLSPQLRFEAVTTAAFTAVHMLGLLLVIIWFYLELKQNIVLAKWILHPLQQYSRDLEFQREIWWALGIDHEVGRLTYEMSPWIDKTRESPYPLSRIVRKVSGLIRNLQKRRKPKPGQAEPSFSTELEKGKKEFRDALEVKFGDGDLVKEVMKTISVWENPYVQDSEEWLKRLRLLLWGYADLKKMLGDDSTGGLVDLRKQMIEAGASNGYTEYLLAGRKDGPDLENQPSEVYYKPGPTGSELIRLQR